MVWRAVKRSRVSLERRLAKEAEAVAGMYFACKSGDNLLRRQARVASIGVHANVMAMAMAMMMGRPVSLIC